MSTVYLKPLYHRGKAQIAIQYTYDQDFISHIKQLSIVKYSSTHRCFYCEFNSQNKTSLFEHLRLKKFYVDYSALNKNKPNQVVKNPLSPQMSSVYQQYLNYLRGKRLSLSTIKVYGGFVYNFLNYLGQKSLVNINNKDVRLFIEEEIKNKNYAISSHRQLVSAIKHLGACFTEINFTEIDTFRPKKSRQLPSVLSSEEIINILVHTKNLKHRTILAFLYASGLRIGELLSLTLSDIDINRKQVFIKNGKGRKDRYVTLADHFLPLLHNYVMTYTPEYYFIEGPKSKKYSASSIRKFLARSCKIAGITKRVTPHTLRHSYATHMLENGVGLRYIQELLGHTKPETTMIYTHVAQKNLMQVESPLDSLVKQITRNAKQEQNFLLSGNNDGI